MKSFLDSSYFLRVAKYSYSIWTSCITRGNDVQLDSGLSTEGERKKIISVFDEDYSPQDTTGHFVRTRRQMLKPPSADVDTQSLKFPVTFQNGFLAP